MGAGAPAPSISRRRRLTDPFHSIFIGRQTQKAIVRFASDGAFRQCFVEYIKDGRWVESLAVYEDHCKALADGSQWERYGYDRPEPRREEGSSKFSLKSSASWQSLGTSFTGFASRQTSNNDIHKHGYLHARETEVVQYWSLCSSSNEVRAILLVMLFPLFFNSCEYKQWMNPSNCAAYSASSGSGRTNMESGTRLRELMLSAAAAFDSCDLDAYLAKSATNLVADFKAALDSLPLRFHVIGVYDAPSGGKGSGGGGKGLELLYESRGRVGSTLASRSAQNLRELANGWSSPSLSSKGSWREPSGVLRSLCGGAEYTPEQRQQVELALKEQTRLKLAVAAPSSGVYHSIVTGTCTLRALKPIGCDGTGTAQCLLSVESLHKVVIAQADDKGSNVGARVFQQVEDLLLLLPALMRVD